jgi:hypothetical protein
MSDAARALVRQAVNRTQHAMACERNDAEDCSCGALRGERAALTNLRALLADPEGVPRATVPGG